MKLTEADANTHSVVGTPYWMAPEVIEMSGVCTASDIWSVGCIVIELLTGAPPYYDLQPMPALFKIVQVFFLFISQIYHMIFLIFFLNSGPTVLIIDITAMIFFFCQWS
ncbi:putative protein kinase STE-STE-Pl family [Helianthus annuus]|nr:putative protein kinase STE-STE-Pl family [Helianthus annuus]